MADSENDVVILDTYHNDWEAHITKGILNDAGLDCFLGNENFGGLYPVGFNSVGGIPVYVRRGDLERAKSIIAGRGNRKNQQ